MPRGKRFPELNTFKSHAWLHGDLGPVGGQAKDPFGGWSATLIDTPDTLWKKGPKNDFYSAVDAVHRNISFETTSAIQISTLETSIRFLGGLLSAYDLSGDKARDVGDLLYRAFGTPGRIPITPVSQHLYHRPLSLENEDILVSGPVRTYGLETSAQHHSCFADGMLALGGRLTGDELHVDLSGSSRAAAYGYTCPGLEASCRRRGFSRPIRTPRRHSYAAKIGKGIK